MTTLREFLDSNGKSFDFEEVTVYDKNNKAILFWNYDDEKSISGRMSSNVISFSIIDYVATVIIDYDYSSEI